MRSTIWKISKESSNIPGIDEFKFITSGSKPSCALVRFHLTTIHTNKVLPALGLGTTGGLDQKGIRIRDAAEYTDEKSFR